MARRADTTSLQDDVQVGTVDGLRRITRSRKRVLLVAGAAVVIVVLAAVGWATLGPETERVHTITGEMALRDSDRFDYDVGDSCSGSGGYGDIAQGAPVTVKNQSGTVIGSGSLGPGTIEGGTTALRACVFPFQVDDVSDAEFFQIEVSRRGALSFSKADMEANGWAVYLTLGD